MKQTKITLQELKTAEEFIDHDSILDPYERMKGDYYILTISKAQYCKLPDQNHDFISLEVTVCEQCGNVPDKEKYHSKGKRLFMNIYLHPKKIGLLKNLCNALDIEGQHHPEELVKMLVDNKVKARVIPRYDHDCGIYFHYINKFDTAL